MKYLVTLFMFLTACGGVSHGSKDASQLKPQDGQVSLDQPALVDAEPTCQYTKFVDTFDNYYSADVVEGFHVFTCNQFEPACEVFKDAVTGQISTSCPTLPNQSFEVN
jgi:hypothetical protein